MFKENRDFWLFLIGIVILFFIIFGTLRDGFSKSSFMYSGFPFGYVKGDTFLLKKQKVDINPDFDYKATLKTNKGVIEIDLLEKQAPNTVGNFIYLSNQGYYKNLEFHRLIKDLLVQGGSRNTMTRDTFDDAFGGPGYTIDDEINWDSLDYSDKKKESLKKDGYKSSVSISSEKLGKYSVAMASNGPNTSGSQFFIVLAENDDPRLDNLDGKHTVFAHVIGGFSVLNEINTMPTKTIENQDPRPDRLVLYSVEVTYEN